MAQGSYDPSRNGPFNPRYKHTSGLGRLESYKWIMLYVQLRAVRIVR